MGAKSIVMQISFAMLIFLLFSDQISGGQSATGGVPLSPLWKKASISSGHSSLQFGQSSAH